MKIAIRMDDITADMDWDRFLAVKALLDAHGVRPLLGVVPDCRDPLLSRMRAREDFWEYLRALEKEGWVLSQHGFQHLYTTKRGGLFPLNRFSEFAGLPYEKQLDMLRQGKRLLGEKGIETDIFMAPAHSYDRNTLRALKDCGFRILTDGFGKRPYLRDGLVFLPVAQRKSAAFDAGEGYTTLVLHTNVMSDGELAWYEEQLDAHADAFISYGELLSVPALKRGAAGNASEYLKASAKRVLVRAMNARSQNA